MTEPAPFWKTKSLEQMTDEEWESLCDGCGQCCLLKLEDEDTSAVAFTNLSCHMLDLNTCKCSDYPNRRAKVPDCVKMKPGDIAGLDWLPLTCAYRLVFQKKDLFWWHPLISNSKDSVHEAGVSVRHKARTERGIKHHNLWRYVTGWLDSNSA